MTHPEILFYCFRDHKLAHGSRHPQRLVNKIGSSIITPGCLYEATCREVKGERWVQIDEEQRGLVLPA